MIHATADFDYAEQLRFTPGAAERGVQALRAGGVIVTDTNMALAGVSKPALAKLGGAAFCYMADPTVAAAAKAAGTTRAVAAMSHAAALHPGAVFAVGNAPTALFALCDAMEAGQFRPALVIGVPVGFVNVVESKERLMAVCGRLGVPAIAAMGRKGGSSVGRRHLQRPAVYSRRPAGPRRPGLVTADRAWRFCICTTGRRAAHGRRFAQWFFYWFYPLHLLALGLLRVALL